jgi:FlaA1/EpsC-like NDP-sugar epimerase
MLTKRRFLVFLVDVVFVATAYVLAFLLRFDFNVSIMERELNFFLPGFAVVLAVKPLVFLGSKLYRSLWRYASMPDAVEIFKTVFLASVVSLVALLFVNRTQPFSRSIVILDWLLLFAMMSASRLVWRAYRETYLIPRNGRDRRMSSRTLIVGAGDAGNMLLKEIRKQPDAAYNVIGLVDDDPRKLGMRLNGVPVLGDTLQLTRLVKDHCVEKVIIALPSANGKAVRAIVRRCKMANVRFKTLPGLSDIINGKVSVSQIKDVEIDDLLRREPVVLDEAAIGSYLTDKKILVTGAGGSIGSEMCRQLAKYNPRKIVLFDSAETPLFHIERELIQKHPNLRVIPILGDIRQADKVEAVFDEFMPEVVFHAAAYKHVPMMEYNPVEAVTNNIGGTKVLADAAAKFGVANFVMVSTDKAVNPTNVMGASKRAAELYVQALAERCATRFTTVRFGNVLGSNGSVIPMFKEQIRNGGPVTVTDPKVIRYFMTIPEASQLVLQAGSIGRGGDIFVLDMGEPVPILELAEELIRLSGLVPYDDIDITFTGLRPGEKLYEELLIEGEGIRPTVHEKIKVVAAVAHDPAWLTGEMERLFAEAETFNPKGIMEALCRLVPEFSPAYHFTGDPPSAFRRLRTDLFPVKNEQREPPAATAPPRKIPYREPPERLRYEPPMFDQPQVVGLP